MSRGLSYTDAVVLLTGSSPVATAAGTAVSGLAGVAGVPNLIDLKALTTRVAARAVAAVRARGSGVTRLERSRRLQAANSILVVSAFFEAFDSLELPVRLADAELSRTDQAVLAGAPHGEGWLAGLLRAGVPAPEPSTTFEAFGQELRVWYSHHARRLAEHLDGLAVADRLDETTRGRLHSVLAARLPDAAVAGYDAAYLRLAADVPEFGLWAWRNDATAKDAALTRIGAGLRDLEQLLAAMASGAGGGHLLAALATAYRADLDTPVAGAEQDTAGCIIPTLDDSYLDPRFVVRAGNPADNPADEAWWHYTDARDDFGVFLAGHLTAPEAAAAPLLVLGQPGSGKSALTRVLAARLPAGDFLPVRVSLRDVPADADLQDQIEHAVRAATGEPATWPDLCRAAAGALPVVLLDGFDELLQATGVSQSDYLMKVAKFQRRELAQGRPVAVLVTSRTAVANRAPLPDGSTVVRLEPFDGERVAAWLRIWNAANADVFAERGVEPLGPAAIYGRSDPETEVWTSKDVDVSRGTAAILRRDTFAQQPLLLLMLALYDAQDNALLRDPAGLDRARLYEQLLARFADREIHKDHDGPLPATERAAAIEQELLRLSIVAFAMLNRDRQWVTARELDTDLAALGLAGPPVQHRGFGPVRTAGDDTVGRFFFIQRGQALVGANHLHTYEFLHATFAEFLVARLAVRILADVTAQEAAGRRSLRPVVPYDAFLYSLLSFAPLNGQGSTALGFAAELFRGADATVAHEWLVRAFRYATDRLDVPSDDYGPAPVPAGQRMTRYGLNLVLLAIASNGSVSASQLYPDDPDPAERLGRAAHGWQATLRREAWQSLVGALGAYPAWHDTHRDVRLDLASTLEPMSPYWAHGVRTGSEIWGYERGDGFAGLASTGLTMRAHALRGDLGEEHFRHALEPLLDRLPSVGETFVVHGPQDAESVAHSLVRAWTIGTAGATWYEVASAYERLVTAATGYGWPVGHADAVPVLRITLALLARDATRLPPERVRRWLLGIEACPQFDRGLQQDVEAVRRMLPGEVPEHKHTR